MADEYICERCGYKSKNKGNLVRHLKRIKNCDVTLSDVDRQVLLDGLLVIEQGSPYKCKHCNKNFNHKSNMYAHQKTCRSKDQTEMNELKEEVHRLKTIINSGFTSVSNNTTNNITNHNTQNNINIQVQLKDFGLENMSALPENIMETLFMDLRFRDLMENLHFDDNFPENKNVRLKSTKRGLMEIYRNNKWDIVTFVNGLNEMIEQGHRIFEEYYRKNRQKILDEIMDESDLRDILKKLNDIERMNKDEVVPIRKELQLLLETHRDNPSNIVTL